jgi:predicted TIM-barrel fold metal-dependent hydrolase
VGEHDVDLPKIISVDDHVVEPPHVWQSWLPKEFREQGPRVECKRWGKFALIPGAKYDMTEDPDGQWGDAWYYEGKLIYVHKRHVAIAEASIVEGPGGIDLDRDQFVMTPITYDEMRKGCWDLDARISDLELNWVDGSLPFPTFPRFCGQTFYEGDDKDLGLACVRAYNDWMVEEWCGPSRGYNIPLCLIPLWDAELAAQETLRNAQRGVRAICFSELPHHLGLPTIHSGVWDPLWSVCNDWGVTVCMHVGSSSTMPMGSPDAPAGASATIGFNNAMASLGDWLYSKRLITFPKLKLAFSEAQIGWIPYALERADTVWEHHNSWQHSKDVLPEPPSTYYYGRIYGCFTADRHGLRSLEEVGPRNICFETDYPHTDTTWPHSKAYAEKILSGHDPEVVYDVLRGNAIRMLELDRT